MAHREGNTTQLQALLDLAAEGDDEAYGELLSRASERLLKLMGPGIASAGAMLDPLQQRLPDKLMAALTGAVDFWQAGERDPARGMLMCSLELAKAANYL